MQSDKFLILADDCSLRLLDKPYAFNRRTDELYEVDQTALSFLARCDGMSLMSDLDADPEFVSYCLGEGLLETRRGRSKRHILLPDRPGGLLRYLELQITGDCNLRCRHCYVSAGGGPEMPVLTVFRTLDQFEGAGGLRLLISGGEPLLHGRFWYLNERLSDYGFRSVLLTNGTLVTADAARRLKVHEAQVSIDGIGRSHDTLRGRGSYEKALGGITRMIGAGLPVSVATMVTRANMADFDTMGRLFEQLGVAEWNVDVPSPCGRMAENPDLMPDPAEAAGFLSYGFGGGFHGGPDGYACGAHLCTVGPDGRVAKCGFYMDRPAGSIEEGLLTCWDRIKPVPLSSLSCNCEYLDDCRGGCRYRAAVYSEEFGPDPVRCRANGVI